MPRTAALFLSVCLLLPGPVWALRRESSREGAGLEEIHSALGGTAGPGQANGGELRSLHPVAERLVEEIFSEEGLEVIPMDGDTGSSKNTLAGEILQVSRQRGLDAVVLDQDLFNFPHARRVALWKETAGQEFLQDAELLEWDRFADLLRQIRQFRDSGAESLQITVPDTFVRGRQERAPLTLTLSRKTKIILAGKYLYHREEVLTYYSTRLRYRVESEPVTALQRYLKRTQAAYGHNPEEMALLENYYRHGMRPSFDLYRLRSEKWVTHRILLDREPFLVMANGRTGPQGEELVRYLKDPQVTGGKTKRWRFLTGPGDTYDAVVQDGFPAQVIPELRGGLSPLMDRLEEESRQRGEGWTWVDAASGIGGGPKEGRVRYPRLRPVLVDAVRWTRDDFPPEVVPELEREAQERGIPDFWATEGVEFRQEDLLQASVEARPGTTTRLITAFQALGYTHDPVGILVRLYNQLAPEGYLLANTYIPTDHPKAGDLVAFYRGLLRDLNRNGIPAEVRVLDQRTEPLPAQKRKPGYPQFQIGMVLRKDRRSPRMIVSRIRPQAAEAFDMQWSSRSGLYQVVSYEGDLAHPFITLSSTPLEEEVRRVPVRSRVLSVELGGTWIRTALVDSANGHILVALPDEPLTLPSVPETVLDLIEERARRVLALAGLTREQIGAVSLSTAGDLEEETGRVILQKKLPFTGQNLRDLLAQRPALAEAPPRASAQRPALAEAPPRASAQPLGGQVFVLNDTVAGAWAEGLYGAGHGRGRVWYLTVSTGTNAASWSAEGKGVDLGLWRYPAEEGRTVEEHTSGAHLADRVRARLSEPGGQEILQLAKGDAGAITAEHVAIAFRAGNPLAAAVVENAARVLGVAIGQAMERTLEAEAEAEQSEALWVVGGAVGQGLGQPFIERIQAYAPRSVRVVLSKMSGNERGLLGAAAGASGSAATRLGAAARAQERAGLEEARLELGPQELRYVDEVLQEADWDAFERAVPEDEMVLTNPAAPITRSMMLLYAKPQVPLFEDKQGVRYSRLVYIGQEEVQHNDAVLAEIPPALWGEDRVKDLFLSGEENPGVAGMKLANLFTGALVYRVGLADSTRLETVRFLRDAQDNNLRIFIEEVLPDEQERTRAVLALAALVSRITRTAGLEEGTGRDPSRRDFLKAASAFLAGLGLESIGEQGEPSRPALPGAFSTGQFETVNVASLQTFEVKMIPNPLYWVRDGRKKIAELTEQLAREPDLKKAEEIRESIRRWKESVDESIAKSGEWIAIRRGRQEDLQEALNRLEAIQARVERAEFDGWSEEPSPGDYMGLRRMVQDQRERIAEFDAEIAEIGELMREVAREEVHRMAARYGLTELGGLRLAGVGHSVLSGDANLSALVGKGIRLGDVVLMGLPEQEAEIRGLLFPYAGVPRQVTARGFGPEADESLRIFLRLAEEMKLNPAGLVSVERPQFRDLLRQILLSLAKDRPAGVLEEDLMALERALAVLA